MLLVRKTFIYLIIIIITLSTIITVSIINKEKLKLEKDLLNKIEYNDKVYNSLISTLLFDLNKDTLKRSLQSLFSDKDIVAIKLIDYTKTTNISFIENKNIYKQSNIQLNYNQEKIGELHIAYTNQNINNYINDYTYNLVLLAISISIVFFIILAYFIFNILKSINYLNNATEQITNGNLDYKIHLKGEDKISMLAKNIHSMKLSLENKLNVISEKLDFQNKVLNTINMAIYIKDKNHNIIDVNDEFLKLICLPKEKIIGNKLIEILDNKYIREINDYNISLLVGQEEKNKNLKMLNANDELKDIVSFESFFVKDGIITNIIGSIYDTSNCGKQTNLCIEN